VEPSCVHKSVHNDDPFFPKSAQETCDARWRAPGVGRAALTSLFDVSAREVRRTCKACQRSLPLDGFATTRKGNGERRRQCRSCTRQHDRKVRLVRETLTSRLQRQGGRCAVHGEELTKICIDIDWTKIWLPGTACFRGLTCTDCNSMLAHAKDDPDRLRAGIRYLGEK
jgi:hypothetical protein